MLNGRECSKYYDSGPCCLISELLGHEGKGSLFQVLNDKNISIHWNVDMTQILKD